MITLDEALDVVMQLSYEQRQMLIDILSKRQSADELTAKLMPAEQRVAGLHSGQIRMSEDFDEPLPEEFWTGTA